MYKTNAQEIQENCSWRPPQSHIKRSQDPLLEKKWIDLKAIEIKVEIAVKMSWYLLNIAYHIYYGLP